MHRCTNLVLYFGVRAALIIIDFLAMLSSLPKRHSELGKQSAGIAVRACTCYDTDIHTGNALDFIEVNFGENNLFRNTERIISVSVESVRIDAAEVLNAG